MKSKGNGRLNNARGYNLPLARRIMELHQKGYELDLIRLDEKHFCCVQDSRLFLIAFAHVRLVDLCYNHYSKTYTYLHSVDTFCGEKGMLAAGEILSTN